MKYVQLNKIFSDQGDDEVVGPLPLYCRRNSSVDKTLTMYQPAKLKLLSQIQEERSNSFNSK